MGNRPANPSTRASTARARGGCSGPQLLILFLVAVVGIAGVALLARALFFTNPQPDALSEIGVSTPQPGPTALVETPQITALPTPAAECARLNNGAWLATGVRVVDNSTLEADVDGVRMLVGYAGISLPEAGPFSAQAVEVIQAFLSESPLVLVRDRSEQDNSGRQVGYIFSGDHFLNLELLQQGLAQADLQGPDQACAALFQQAELDARAKKIGLWQPALAPTATFHPLVTVSPRLPESCICSSRPSCTDFQTHDEAQVCFNACNDYNSRLDEDHDGVACEELP